MRIFKKKKVLSTIFLLAISAVYLIPILMMVLGSFKSQQEVLAFDLSLPTHWMVENYSYVLETGNILLGYMNSAIITFFSVVIVIFTGTLAGVTLARNKSKRSEGLYYFFIFGLTFTMQMVSTFVMLKFLNLYGTYVGIIMLFAAMNMPLTVMMTTSFVKSVPRELDEAALIDGCSYLKMVIKIMFPVLKPIIVTNLTIVAIGVWNNFMLPLYFLNSSDKMTIPLTVYNYFGLYSRSWQYVFAAMVLTVLPIVILYLFMQKHIVAGMTAGAVKG